MTSTAYPRILLFLCCLLALMHSASAQSGNITLLTVSEDENGTLQGGTASMFLELRPGTGAIFIDSAPLTKLDTQISTRFAAQVACDFAQTDCSRYDFFYTIRAGAPIVGGPSAGAATAALTVAVLKGLHINQDVVMTGTINAGGIIGPVAGVREKIAAASRAGFSTVLVPFGNTPLNETADGGSTNASNASNISNTAITPFARGEARRERVSIHEVSTLQEAVALLTGYTENYASQIDVPEDYTRIMREIAEGMCARYPGKITQTMLLLDDHLGLTRPKDTHVILYLRGRHALEQGTYYSAASFCFGANQLAREEQYALLNDSAREQHRASVLAELDAFESNITAMPLQTLTDIETYVIVKERITEARGHLEPRVPLAPYRASRVRLARAEERLYSAKMWARFFGTGTGLYDVKENQLRSACLKKIAETEERIQYALIYFPQLRQGSALDAAREQYAKKEYPLCIYQASKLKAEMELLLVNLFVDTANETLVQTTINQTRLVIARQHEEGLFPLMGYSYYEYALSLEPTDPSSALLYANYALELSNLDDYFPKTRTGINTDHMILLAEGFVLGVLVTLLLTLLVKKPRKTPRKEESSREKR